MQARVFGDALMDVEIEAKLKVDSLGEIAEKLPGLGAELQHQVLQTDYFFDDAKKSLTKADSCLRLRRESIGSQEKVVLAFKGPREKTQLKKRAEIQISLQDADVASELLEALGFEKKLTVQKKRQLWRLMGCEVALDELPLLGEFVEIEGPGEEQIAEVQKKLGLADLPYIAQSYASLLEDELSRRGIGKREVFFNLNCD